RGARRRRPRPRGGTALLREARDPPLPRRGARQCGDPLGEARRPRHAGRTGGRATIPVMPPLVSIIIPAYNYERYINDVLGSVTDQTYDKWECIVVDDGSTDDTAGVVRYWAMWHPLIRLVQHDTNKGVSAARNRGFAESSGELIQFLDADDRLLREKLARHVRFLEEHPETGVV